MGVPDTIPEAVDVDERVTGVAVGRGVEACPAFPRRSGCPGVEYICAPPEITATEVGAPDRPVSAVPGSMVNAPFE